MGDENENEAIFSRDREVVSPEEKRQLCLGARIIYIWEDSNAEEKKQRYLDRAGTNR